MFNKKTEAPEDKIDIDIAIDSLNAQLDVLCEQKRVYTLVNDLKIMLGAPHHINGFKKIELRYYDETGVKHYTFSVDKLVEIFNELKY